MVVVAYLMAREGWSREETMAFVRERRTGLRPNPAFRELLLEWQRSLAP
jgi:protein-tyrosine phosphatase